MSGSLWTLPDLVTASGGTLDGEARALVTGISIDSRAIQPGDLFVALKDQRDGHEFVTSAFAAGAAAALVSAAYARQPGDGPLIRVDDTLLGLREIARAARARLSTEARVIAVTGSAGKTTTKEMLRTALASIGPTHAADKSFNNHWGVPLTLARMPRETQFAVIEIGMNHAGEIADLVPLARPHVAIVLNVLPAHLGHFDSIEGIARAKAEIFSGLVEGGTAILNADTNHTDVLLAAARRATATVRTFGLFSQDDSRDAWPTNTGDPMGPGQATARIGLRSGGQINCPMPAPGWHISLNAAAMVLALKAVGADPERAIRALHGMAAPAGRGERIWIALPEDGKLLLIDESYNANPGSMAAAISTVRGPAEAKGTRLVLVLGEMLELGEHAEKLHNDLREIIGKYHNTLVFAAGPNMSAMFDGLPEPMRGGKAATAAELQQMVLAALQPGDVVMVKGSNGSKVWQIANVLKQMRQPAR
ncbi:MAG: UDP-N-acetylmuramoyl-tripeptide--D-alanyl-D-alanine ligase [Hyphomicrobiaceae bacterium]|nr:UDP-N-acetylmuramoyl-tripeptide--D-alanyl-D-alanine ligase [Hyphomicrobiaceae bacterium]